MIGLNCSGFREQGIASECRDHHHDGDRMLTVPRRLFVQAAKRLQAVHARHLPVEQDHVEGMTLPLRALGLPERGCPGRCGGGAHLQRLQLVGERASAQRVVIDHQNMKVSDLISADR